ncbi:MAG: DUF998 domain-containing protein [Candidatus Lokiarchaeota archaeon]|nr:DUF998 domain-containing protein [Candidatus Lokiarchaeota archaeon]
MRLLYLLNNKLSSIYKIITNVKFVKITTILGIFSYTVLFFLSFIITIYFGNNPFSPMSNFISELGKLYYSPTPFIFDLACIISGIFTFPFAFYFLKHINLNFEDKNSNNKHNKLFRRLRISSFLSIIIGDIGFIGIGIFSLDRNYFYMHFFSASFVLCGYISSTFFISLLIVLKKFSLPTIMGVIGLICVIFLLSFAIVANLIFLFSITIFEWSLVIFVSIWLYSFTLFLVFKKPIQWFL